MGLLERWKLNQEGGREGDGQLRRLDVELRASVQKREEDGFILTLQERKTC